MPAVEVVYDQIVREGGNTFHWTSEVRASIAHFW